MQPDWLIYEENTSKWGGGDIAVFFATVMSYHSLKVATDLSRKTLEAN